MKAIKPPLKPVEDPAQHAAKFAIERLQPHSGQSTPLVDMLAAYGPWCETHGFEQLSQADFATELSRLFQAQGFRGEMVDGEPRIIGIAIKV